MTQRSALFDLQARHARAQAARQGRDLTALQARAQAAGQMHDRIAALLSGLGGATGPQSVPVLRDTARLGATLQAEQARHAQTQQLLHQQIAQARAALDAQLRVARQAQDAAQHHRTAEAAERAQRQAGLVPPRRIPAP